MTTIRGSQFSTVAAIAGIGKIRASQFSSVSISGNAPSTLRASQFAIITVVANAKNVLSLGPGIVLPCWQPCTAFGTYATVVRFR